MVSQSNGATQNVAAMQMSGFRHKRKAANSCAESGAEIFNVRFGKSVKAELLSFLTGRLSVKNGEGKVDILNVKLDPLTIDFLLKQKGFFPAYHMGKGSWISICLDKSVDFSLVCELLDQSYNNVKK